MGNGASLKLLALRATVASRWARENAFTLVVMGPLVLGGAALIFQPYLEDAGRALRSGVAPWATEHAGALAGAFVVILLVARMSSAIRDAFAVDGDDAYLDALPIGPMARLHDVLAVRAFKALPVAAGVFVAFYMAAPAGVTIGSLAARAALPLLVGAAGLAVLETGAAVAVVRLRLVTVWRLAACGALACAIAVAAEGHAASLAVLAVAAAYGVAAFGFVRWRVADRDTAREALARARRTGVAVERFADRTLGARVGAQVVRDLRLVRRGFSTAPMLAAAVTIVLFALAIWASKRFELDDEQRFQLVEGAVVLSAFALAAITHSLVTYERTRIWLDMTSGVTGEDFPRAKLWLGRTLAAPVFVLGCASAAAAGVAIGPLDLVKLGWLTWATATLTAVLCYEIKERPVAGLVLAFLPAVGLSALLIFYPFGHFMWYLTLFGYVYASFNLLDRAKLKVEWEE